VPFASKYKGSLVKSKHPGFEFCDQTQIVYKDAVPKEG